MRLEEVIKRQGEYLEWAAVPEGRTDAEWIISAVTGLGRVRLRLEKDAVLTQEQCKETERLCARRAQREPLQYILGTQSFMSLELHTDARALIPRPETELLGEYCVQEIKRAYGRKKTRFTAGYVHRQRRAGVGYCGAGGQCSGSGRGYKPGGADAGGGKLRALRSGGQGELCKKRSVFLC